MTASTFIQKKAEQQQLTKVAISLSGEAGILSSIAKGFAELYKKHPGKMVGSGVGLLVGGALLGPTLSGVGHKLRQKVFPNTREDSLKEEGIQAYVKSLGSQLGQSSANVVQDALTKGLGGLVGLQKMHTQGGVFSALQKSDPVLAKANKTDLKDAYKTLVRFAPTIATDKNAVRSFLRESVLYGSGPNIMTIKQVAEAERATHPDRR